MIEFARSRRIATPAQRIWPFVEDMAPRPIGNSFEGSLARLADLAEARAPG
jgi:hypothetical protein